jgi:hypothetical protein
MYGTFDQSVEFEQIINAYDDDLLRFFNMDTDIFGSVKNYISGEFLVFYSLIAAVYGVFVGANSVAGKIKDKTLPFYLSKGISRVEFLITDLISSISRILFENALVAASVYLFARIYSDGESVEIKYFLAAFAAAAVLQLFFYLLGLLVGVWQGRGRAVQIGVAFAILSWFIDSFSRLESFPDGLDYFSAFNYYDLQYLLDNSMFNIADITFLLILSFILTTFSLLIFRKSDISF